LNSTKQKKINVLKILFFYICLDKMPKEIKNQTARVYSSPIIEDFAALPDPTQRARIATRMQFAAAIADAMKAKGMNKKALATALKQHPSIITKWLSGKHNFTTDTLTDIGQILQIKFFAHEVESFPEVQIHLSFDLYSTTKIHAMPLSVSPAPLLNPFSPSALS
jgi:transcriptional regulator with XRE-family HTH domain